MKPPISIGSNIYRLRKEARLTQDDLAMHLGVTKASVSKWETGQSYPDIELLPKIAAYFDTTIDKLVGYEPQLSKDGIARECARLRVTFATEPFETAHEQCQSLVHEYFSCYPLLMQIALMYLNHMDLVQGNARESLVDEAIELCHRVQNNSKSPIDIKLAQAVEASFLLATGKPQSAVEVLEGNVEVDLGTDLLLANAYGASGRIDEADEALQGAMFQAIVLVLNRLSQLAMLYVSNPEKLDIAHRRAKALMDAFDLEKVYVNAAAVHLSFAMAYIAGGNIQGCLDCLDDYERAARMLEFPVKIHGDEFFDRIESWIEKNDITGTAAPRDDVLNRKSLLESVSLNPAFAALENESRFTRIVKSLEEVIR